MKIYPYHLYHVFNQGNNRRLIFKERSDYLHFLKKVKTLIVPTCEIINWCLMPNHFHFIIGTNYTSVEPMKQGGITLSRMANAFRILEYSFARSMNQKNGDSGSLFRQHTQAKQLTEEAFFFDIADNIWPPLQQNLYPQRCFMYVHDNPVEGNLVSNPIDWEFSSYRDYAGIRDGKLCNRTLAERWLGKMSDWDFIV